MCSSMPKAEEALQKSFAIAPDNFDASKVETFLQLERHEYARALEIATKLNKKTPERRGGLWLLSGCPTSS